MTTRTASHAGSWYEKDPAVLSRQLDKWIAATGNTNNKQSRLAVIVPHAGLSYSGATAAFAWAAVDVTKVKRVFILGPSHHVAIPGRVACTMNHVFDTPLGGIQVDRNEITQLLKTKLANGNVGFMELSRDADEDEHSIEMHLPYIKHTFDAAGNFTYTIVPLVVGSLNEASEKAFAEVLSSRTRLDGSDLIVISSDFAHWGERFGYQYIYDNKIPIHESIEKVDRIGLGLIESKSHKDFADYLRATHNTICGRHPIGIWLAWIHLLPCSVHVELLAYTQSSRVKSMKESSVSYASVLFVKGE